MSITQKRFCPNCGSPDIEWELPQTWSKWRCKNCGYIGALIIDNSEIAQKIKEEYQKRLYCDKS